MEIVRKGKQNSVSESSSSVKKLPQKRPTGYIILFLLLLPEVFLMQKKVHHLPAIHLDIAASW